MMSPVATWTSPLASSSRSFASGITFMPLNLAQRGLVFADHGLCALPENARLGAWPPPGAGTIHKDPVAWPGVSETRACRIAAA
jgi:hypothetical protein